MVYHVIGTMSGSSMDGLDIAYCILEENGGKWTYEIAAATCVGFDEHWKNKLKQINDLDARSLLRMHTDFGHWMGHAIHQFIETNQLQHKIHLVASHGHTAFHEPQHKMTFQLGDGAAIASVLKLPVVSDLRNMDIALGGQGAPIVPVCERLLWNEYTSFLNMGGICNISIPDETHYTAFDVCPANRVLNLLAQQLNKNFDQNGEEASQGKLNADLLQALNSLAYYQQPPPKSLANEFGTDLVFSLIEQFPISVQDKLHTFCIHIAQQVALAIKTSHAKSEGNMLVTGGGALNGFLMQCLQAELVKLKIELAEAPKLLIEYKEALAMALIGILRWREENNVFASVTGATRNSVGGALWMGQE